MSGLLGASVVGVFLVGNVATLDAGGFSVGRFGHEAGHAATDRPAAIYYNPAGLARGAGASLYAEGLLGSRRLRYERPEGAIDRPLAEGESGPGTPAEATAANAGSAEGTGRVRTSFAALTGSPEDSNFGWGLAVYAPAAPELEWPRNTAFAGSGEYPGAVDGIQRWHAIRAQSRSARATAGAAYRWRDAGVAAGIGASAILTDIRTVRARTRSGADDLVGENGEIAEGREVVKVSSVDFGLTAGVQWMPDDALTLGLSYESSPGLGEMDLGGRAIQKFGSGARREIDARLLQTLPDVYRIGAAYRVPELDVEIRGSGDFQRWSRLSRQCLVRDGSGAACADGGGAGEGDGVIWDRARGYDDSFGARLGVSYWPIPEAEASLSLGHQTSAVPDEALDPASADAGRWIISAGGRYELPADGSAVSANLQHVAYSTRDVGPRAGQAGDPPALGSPSRRPDPAGTYEQRVTLFSVGFEGRF